VRIAQVAPLAEAVPPAKYGGTERVVSYLTEALVDEGHQVTLFAAGDSVTSAKLAPCCPRSLREDRTCADPLAWHLIELDEVARRAEEFDIIHFHTDYLHFPIASRLRTPHVTTLHGRLDLPELPAVHRAFPHMPVISISNAQRLPLPNLNWLATVYHGLPDTYGACSDGGDHLTFLGRISPEKRVDRAIQIAIGANVPLVIAAKVDPTDQAYFEQQIAPLLAHPLVEYVGEVNDRQKQDLFRTTRALLFPIDWPEPFGLVLIEALACGVPVVAFRCGSVPEIVENNKVGYIVDSVPEAIAAVRRISSIDRGYCRAVFSSRFRASRMALDYVRVYDQILGSDQPKEELQLANG
jgi:glycosyltransferase involved in cell wall biosynthesis